MCLSPIKVELGAPKIVIFEILKYTTKVRKEYGQPTIRWLHNVAILVYSTFSRVAVAAPSVNCSYTIHHK